MSSDMTIPHTMTAVVLTKPGEYELQEIAVPTYGDTEALCRVESIAICGSDPKMFRGETAGKWPPEYPFVIGHEWAGTVVAVGKGVKSLQVGDRVAAEAHSGCGVCKNCLRGAYNLCENYGKAWTGHRHYGHLSTGAYAQYAAYTEKSLTRMPDSVTFDEGALVDTAGAAFHAIELTGVSYGGTSVVIGPGAIGIMAVKFLKTFGASRIVVVGRGYRLGFAEAAGADYCVDFEKLDPVNAVREYTDKIGADEVYECSGAPGTLRQSVAMAKRGGKVALIGIPNPPLDEEVPFNRLVLDEIGVFGSRANPNASEAILSLMAGGRIDVNDIITHRFPISRFRDALDTFVGRKDNALKVIVRPNR